MFGIGVITDSLRLPVRQGIEAARKLGASGIQCYATAGETAPENLTATARKELRSFCSDLGMTVAALCGDLGGHGFRIREENERKIRRSREIVDLACDLGTKIVTTHIGVVPENSSGETYSAMIEACRAIAAYAADRGVTLAVETGPEPAVRLAEFLRDADSPGLGVNFDPANLVMVVGDDPAAGVKILSRYIVHTHAKDGVRISPCDPEDVYDAFARGGESGFDFGKYFDEVPLGRGHVEWDAYLSALKDIGYTGFLTIERETGADPFGDIASAVRFLSEKLKAFGG